MAYEKEFYREALAETQCKLADRYKQLERHSPGTPMFIEIGLIIQALRQEIIPLRKLAYPENH